jgi:hypothetical protein
VADWVSREAIRAVTELRPLPKLTPVYSSQLLLLIQPTSWPPPVPVVVSVPTLLLAENCDAVTLTEPEPSPVPLRLGGGGREGSQGDGSENGESG